MSEKHRDREEEEVSIELGERSFDAFSKPPTPTPTMPPPSASASSSPVVSILSYCGSSILMTVTNKYVLSGTNFNLNFFLLCVQVRHHHTHKQGRKEGRYKTAEADVR